MTKEQMNTELSEIRTYYMMKRTLDESVTEFEEMFQLLDKYLKIILLDKSLQETVHTAL